MGDYRGTRAPVTFDAAGSYRPVEQGPGGAGAGPDAPGRTSPVVLLGRDCMELERIDSAGLPARAGLALSRGRLPKAYWHLDPNEDGILAATGATGWLLAVADGHTGFDAAQAALAGVASACPALDDRWSSPEVVVQWAVDAARVAVTEALTATAGVRRGSRTALSVVLVSGNRAYLASYGDCVALRVRGRKVTRLGTAASFLGPRSPAAAVTSARLRRGDWVVLGSDGLPDFLGSDLPAALHAAIGSEDPRAAAFELVAAACAAGAGDNVAAGVLAPERAGRGVGRPGG